MATPPRNTTIKGQPHYLAYITPEEGQVLKDRGGAGLPGPMGIPSYFDVGEGVGGYGSGQAGDATAGTGDPDAGRTGGGTYADDQQDLSDPQQYANAQRVFNMSRGITESNPFGADNFFTKYLGINPASIKYDIPTLTGTVFKNGIIKKGGVMQGIPAAQYYAQMGGTPAQQIANNQFSKFINPQNKPDMPGYNPNFKPAEEGQLRAGVQEEGYATTYGPVMEQARQQSMGEMVARGAASLLGGPLLGAFLANAGVNEYGLPGQPGFESFDPENPRQGGGLLGQMFGGVNPSQAKDLLVGAFSPVAPAPTPTQIGSVTPSQYETRADIIARTSQHPLTGETTVPSMVSAPSSSLNAPPQYDVKVPSSLSEKSLSEKRAAIEGMIKNNYGAIPAELQTAPISPGYSSGITKSSISPTAGEQLAEMNFFERMIFENNLSPETKEIMRQKGMTVDDLLAPKQQQPGAQKPDLMDLIQGVTQTSALGGPATANQYADLSGLFSQGMTAIGDIVSIPGGYMDTRTGKQYSGRYNPSSSARTYTGTQRPSGVAPFSGAALRQGLANLWGN